VIYDDVFQYSFQNILPNNNFNILCTAGLANLKSVIVMPLLNQASNGVSSNYNGTGAAVITDTLLSPFTTTGATVDPVCIKDFNLMISGRNLFMTNQVMNFEFFVEQLSCCNQLDGNTNQCLASGLVDYDAFNSGLYRYYNPKTFLSQSNPKQKSNNSAEGPITLSVL
jgi:hypothetical protein